MSVVGGGGVRYVGNSVVGNGIGDVDGAVGVCGGILGCRRRCRQCRWGVVGNEVAGDGVEDVGDRVVRDRAGDVGDTVVVASVNLPTASLEMLLSAMVTVLISAMVSMLRWRIRRRRRRCLLVQVTAR